MLLLRPRGPRALPRAARALARIRAAQSTPTSTLATALLVTSLAGALLVPPASAHAQTYDAALFSGMRWRLLGPFRAGRSVTATGVPGDPTHYYFGAVAGGVWETHDAGLTWRPIFDDAPVASVGALVVAPSNQKVLYVGTGEADLRTDISYGDGVYRSDDGGATWRHLGLDDTRRIGRIVVDPTNPDRVFVAALGHAYGPNAQRGVYRTTDGGKTWRKVLSRDENTGAVDLAMDPSDPNTIYAALWGTRRPPWNVYPPSNSYGAVYRSTDGGDHWTKLEGGLPGGAGVGRIGIAVAPSDPHRLYAQVDAVKGGVYRSDDGGATWRLMDDEDRIWHRGWYFGSVTVDPKNPDVVYVMNTSAYRSTDGGKTFEGFKGAPGGDDYHQLWINPDDPRRMVLAVDQGVIVSLNGGRSWSSWNNQPTGQFYHVITDDRFPYRVYGSEQDSGAREVISQASGFGGISFHDWGNACAGGESGYIAIDPTDWRTLFGTSYDGSVTRCDQATGVRQDVTPQLAFPDSAFQAKWTLPVVFSRAGAHALYFGNDYVWRSDDGGQSWTRDSPVLTRKDAGAPPNLDEATAGDLTALERSSDHWGVVYSIAPSPHQAAQLWAGTDDGLVWRTTDAGARWQNVTPPALTPWSTVSMIEASHTRPEEAYAAIDRHQLDDFDPHLYRTRDGGATWEEVVAGIPSGAYLHAIREDPVRQGLLFAGSELGPYVSFDDGDHWQPLRLNLPVTSIRDFDVRQNDLVVATHGRAFWVLDDIAPLRQLDGKVAAADAWLFRPDTATLVRSRGRGAPSPEVAPYMDPVELAAGENPPAGATLDYYLARPVDSVAIEVLDASGGVVRRFSSTEKPRPRNPRSMDVPAAWAGTPDVLSAAAGMHRWSWDLRYALGGGAGGGGFFGGGPWAPPGSYTVRLSVDGRTLAQPLAVRPDPRSAVTPATLAAQLDMARRIHAAQDRASAAVRQVTSLRAAIDSARTKAAGRNGLVRDLARLDDRAHDLLGRQAKPNPDAAGVGDGGPAPNTLLYLRGFLGGLERSVTGGDFPPTAQAKEGFRKADATLGETLSAWTALRNGDVARLDARLRKAGLPGLLEGAAATDGGR